ncbi:MAG: Asp23/Gls24 family envelope stress response protein [Turicibacter sp.]|nr:Asp23/Gls24 family envelope stress response protein [Turicibacter sp.]
MPAKYYTVSKDGDGSVAVNVPSFKIMARGALAEVKGICKTFETVSTGITEKFNSKKHRSGVEVEFEADGVVIDVYLSILAGEKIVEVATNVQTAIHDMIENMTSMRAKAVYVHVVDIDFE